MLLDTIIRKKENWEVDQRVSKTNLLKFEWISKKLWKNAETKGLGNIGFGLN